MTMRMYQVDYYENGAWHNYLCAGTSRKYIEQREYLSFLAEGRRINKNFFKVHRIETVDGYFVKLMSPKTREKEFAKYRHKEDLRKERNRRKAEKALREAEEANAIDEEIDDIDDIEESEDT